MAQAGDVGVVRARVGFVHDEGVAVQGLGLVEAAHVLVDDAEVVLGAGGVGVVGAEMAAGQGEGVLEVGLGLVEAAPAADDGGQGPQGLDPQTVEGLGSRRRGRSRRRPLSAVKPKCRFAYATTCRSPAAVLTPGAHLPW